jgi:hypothetical protein
MKTHYVRNVRYWYDRPTRCWWAAQFDDAGNQMGDAVYAATRDGIWFAIQTVFKTPPATRNDE